MSTEPAASAGPAAMDLDTEPAAATVTEPATTIATRRHGPRLRMNPVLGLSHDETRPF